MSETEDIVNNITKWTKRDDKDKKDEYTSEFKETLFAPGSTQGSDVGYQPGDDILPQAKTSLRKYLKATLDASTNAFVPRNDWAKEREDVLLEAWNPSLGVQEPAKFNEFTAVSNVQGDPVVQGGAAQALNEWKKFLPSKYFAPATGDLAWLDGAGQNIPPGIGQGFLELDNPKNRDYIHKLLRNVVSQDFSSITGEKYLGDPPDPNGIKADANPALHQTLLMQKKISRVLAYNRFSPSENSPFITTKAGSGGKNVQFVGNSPVGKGGLDNGGEPLAATGGSPYTQQTKLGKWDLKDADPVTFDQLRQIGVRLMIAATGQDWEYHPNALNPDSVSTSEPIVPIDINHVQLATKRVDIIDLMAWKMAKHLGIDPHLVIPDFEITEEIERELPGMFGFLEREKSQESYGALNHPEEKFGGVSFGMVIIAISIMLTLMLIAWGIGALFDYIWRSFQGDGKTTERGRYYLGKSLSKSDSDQWAFFFELFGIPYFNHPFFGSFSRGMAIFFGFPPFESMYDSSTVIPKPVSFESVMEKVINILYGPGFYVVIMRGVNRDTDQITESIGELGQSGGGVFSAIANFLNVLDKIISSMTFKWVIRMAQVGDIYQDSLTPHAPSQAYPYGDDFGLEEGPFTGQNRVDRHRIGKTTSPTGDPTPARFNNVSSLAFGTTATAEIVPISIGLAAAAVNPANNIAPIRPDWFNKVMPNLMQMKSINGAHLSPEKIKTIQKSLDAEYMPFWFQDLRTNEIISFHAFLTTLNENFSPDWTNEEGLGRVDDIRIYKKTSRSISLSFLVAAMNNKQELGMMWEHIDRFIAMVYPQYSAGSQYKAVDGQTFRMPFSQVMTASPVIRMRLGELIGSNYSKFGIARLFGADEPGFARPETGEGSAMMQLAPLLGTVRSENDR